MQDLMLTLKKFSYNLRNTSGNIEATDSANGKGANKKDIVTLRELGVQSEFLNSYDLFFGFKLLWTAKPETGIKATGSIRIMELPKVFGDWEGHAYFSHSEEDSLLRDFKIVDFYQNEYAAGILFGKRRDFTFYNIEIGGEDPVSLDLDINGYIEMMMQSKGYTYWQTVIEYYLHGGYQTDITEQFKHDMPILFPDWTWEGFVQKFEEIRLHKVK